MNPKKALNFLGINGPWILWCLLIFYFSSLSVFPSFLSLGLPDKFHHTYLYLILAFLTLRTFLCWPWFSQKSLAYSAAFLFSSLYGASDEFHQAFVPGRTPDVKDWFADVLGTTLGVTLFWILQKRKVRSA